MTSLGRIELRSGVQDAGGDAVPSLVRIGLPMIGARSTLADVLRLFGHEPAQSTVALGHHFTNRRVHRGQSLVVAGQTFENLYLTLSGSFKSTLHEADGTQQVVAFPLRGDLIGFDAVQGGRYPVTVIALEESNVALIPHREIVELAQTCPLIEHALLAAISAELMRNYRAMCAMGTLGAEARLARFLRDFGDRFARFGFSPQVLRLTMTRADIASYLGLALESVSRAFSLLAERGFIDVSRRRIRIVDGDRLDHAKELKPHSLQRQMHALATRRKRAAETTPRAHLELTN